MIFYFCIHIWILKLIGLQFRNQIDSNIDITHVPNIKKESGSEFLSPDRTVISQFEAHSDPNRGVIKGASLSIFLLFVLKVKKKLKFSYSICSLDVVSILSVFSLPSHSTIAIPF